MSNDVGSVKVTAANIEPAIALAEPIPESASASYQVTTLEDLVDEVQESTLSDAFKQQAYGEWQARAAEQSG